MKDEFSSPFAGKCPSRSLPQGGEAKTILKRSLALGTQHATKRRKEANSIPSPFGAHRALREGASGHADQPRQSG